MRCSFLPIALVALGSVATAVPQSTDPLDPVLVAERIAAWSGRSSWRAWRDRDTGLVEFLHGDAAEPSFRPIRDEDFVALAHLAAADTAGMTGVEPSTLGPGEFHYLPLGLGGTTDKVCVRLPQAVGGVEVVGGAVNVLFDLSGRMLSVQTTALDRVAGLETVPTLGSPAARRAGLAAFRRLVGLPGVVRGEPRLVIGGVEVGGRPVGRLAWEVDVAWHARGAEPEGRSLWIDAHDGTLLDARSTVHHADVGGTVMSEASTGLRPDHRENLPVSVPVPYVRVQSAAGITYTDADGHFLYPGVDGPLDVVVRYLGPFARVSNLSGSDLSLSETIDGTGNVLSMNTGGVERTTSQANAFLQIGVLRDWIRSVDPTDDTADFMALAEVNFHGHCNAFFDGDSVVFYLAGEAFDQLCVNTAYSTVVAHEMGHWLNVLYSTGNAPDGMGEGNADTWAMYCYDTPVMGADFFGLGTEMRSGWNTRQYCGDCCPMCHGGAHDNGEVWMGTTWKVRDRLNQTHGNDLGDAIANGLFLGWMNAYDQVELHSVIEAQWLTLDDDDGNIDNGTPHFADIDGGFRDQGFPGLEVAPISITDVSDLPDTADEAGPYAVEATVVATDHPPLASVELVWRVNGGAWNQTPMSTIATDVFRGEIPGQSSVAFVEYHVAALDGSGNPVTYPPAAPEAVLHFYVGLFELFGDDLESGPAGWTHGSFGDTANDNDDFQRGIPYGKAGDPAAAFSGTFVIGNNLGGTNLNGRYQGNQHNWLRTPVIDCSAAVGTRLRFQRWLNVEGAWTDQARMAVNGTEIYVNSTEPNTEDTGWTWFDLDISALADGQSEVQIEWSIQSEFLQNFGGWTLDDVQVLYLAPGAGCLPPATYGAAKTNSLDREARLGWSGSPSLAADDFVVTVEEAVPDAVAVLYSGWTPDSVPFFGGARLVRGPFVREEILTLDAAGAATVPIPVDPAAVGSSEYFQLWYADPAHPDSTGVGLSDGLVVSYCD
ncbi:MAG: hypothetical protein QF410_01925 [Planctomycetota bacterium]|jgi:hypothetical protein|nr:hypothetical protein [Planctomycetota bacterium]